MKKLPKLKLIFGIVLFCCSMGLVYGESHGGPGGPYNEAARLIEAADERESDPHTAMQMLADAYELAPKNVWIGLRRGDVYAWQGQIRLACREYNAVIAHYPNTEVGLKAEAMRMFVSNINFRPERFYDDRNDAWKKFETNRGLEHTSDIWQSDCGYHWRPTWDWRPTLERADANE